MTKHGGASKNVTIQHLSFHEPELEGCSNYNLKHSLNTRTGTEEARLDMQHAPPIFCKTDHLFPAWPASV